MSPICSSLRMTRAAAWSRAGSEDWIHWKALALLMLGFPDLDIQKEASKTGRRDSLTLDQVY